MENVLLIIEDDRDQSDLLFRYLMQDRYYINFAFDASEALQTIEKQYPHLILLDLHLPFVNGLEVIKKLKNNFETRTIPVIAVSIDEELCKEAVRLGAKSYLSKPIDKDRLREEIRNVMREKLKILFVDDDPDIIELLKEAFSANFAVYTASSGKDAYDIYLKEDLNLIITDIAMTELSGIKLIKKIRQSDQRTPIIVTSGVAKDQLKDCMICGADNLLEKPFDVLDLDLIVRKVLKLRFPQFFEQIGRKDIK